MGRVRVEPLIVAAKVALRPENARDAVPTRLAVTPAGLNVADPHQDPEERVV